MKFAVLSVAALAASAVPALAQVSIMGDVTDTTVYGNLGFTATYNDPSSYHFWTFTATAGETIDFSAARTTFEFDPAIFIFEGNMAGAAFDGTDPYNVTDWLGFTYVTFADDEVGHPGPYGDPAGSFVAGVTGTYTLIVTSALSNPAGPDGYGYSLTVVPAPASLALLGLAGFATRRRR